MGDTGAVTEELSSESSSSLCYRPYTTQFDVIATAAELDAHLGRLNPYDHLQLEQAWLELQSGLAPWRTKLHLLASEADARIRAGRPADERASTVVSLLFDQSGSMRGQKMLFAAATADVVREFLVTLGIRCEVLGFTTVRWLGGKSRRRWRWKFKRPPQPGRLNDLLHVIYKNADDVRASTGGPELKQMLRHDLPKENIDGEAIGWASDRLLARPEPRKLLIVLSDGAPVDDSTLLANGPTYLVDHLKEVVEKIHREEIIKVAALGIGYAAHEFYEVSAHVEAPAELGEALVRLVERMLLCEALP